MRRSSSIEVNTSESLSLRGLLKPSVSNASSFWGVLLQWLLASVLRGMQWALKGYRWVSMTLINPITGPKCRFYPSCSAYALSLIQTLLSTVKPLPWRVKGALIFWMIRVVAWRILRCSPWHYPSRENHLREGVDMPPAFPSLR